MRIEYVPLLRIARDLHDIPRGMERFQAYLNTLINDAGDNVELVPLVAMNPMGREHVAARLDELLALGADEVAAEAAREAEARLATVAGDWRVGLVLLDDVRGGWTNRYLNDAGYRFPSFGDKPRLVPNERREARDRWISVPLSVQDEPSLEKVRQGVLAGLFRRAWVNQHGAPDTLRRAMAQEGQAARFAGATEPSLDPDDLGYTREVLQPLLDTDHWPTIFAAMYGDEAAETVGYAPIGLSPLAGFALALAEARAREEPPEAMVASNATIHSVPITVAARS